MTINRILYKVFALCALASILFTSCREKDDDVKMKTLTISQTATKSSLDEVSGALSAVWESGDKFAVHNLSRTSSYFSNATADQSSASTTITGKLYCDKDDELSLLFPFSIVDTVKGTSGSIYALDISQQDGTLESIGKNVWLRFAKAKVTSVDLNTNTAEGQVTTPFMPALGIAQFNFKVNGNTPSEISRICVSDIITCVKFDNKQDPNSNLAYEKYTETGFIDIKENVSKDNYVALFPGENKAVFYVTADDVACEGTATFNISMGKITDVNVDLKPISESDYIEIGGVKWAPANFIFDGDWKIADKESFSIESNSVSKTYTDIFNWGVLGNRAREYGKTVDYYLSVGKQTFIDGVMYKDKQGKSRTYSYNKATYGDVVYWATKGKYRLPSHSDLYCIAPLATEAITSIDGIISEFTTVDGMKGYKFTDETNGNSMFLPAGGYRDIYGNRVAYGEIGRYFSGNSTSASNATVLYFDKDRIVMTDTHVGDNGHMGYKSYGAYIRPVLAE